jgi:hypothetical protein
MTQVSVVIVSFTRADWLPGYPAAEQHILGRA